jgi:hypothetical protein
VDCGIGSRGGEGVGDRYILLICGYMFAGEFYISISNLFLFFVLFCLVP